MKDVLRSAIDASLERLRNAGDIPADAVVDYQVETPRQADHGDFSTNIAMLLAKPCKRPPREIATRLVAELRETADLERVDVAGPGFINFVVAPARVFSVVETITAHGGAFGRSEAGRGQRVQVEFVSANPTGPLHIGHGRGAAIGSVIANLLEATGHDVQREYYVNDAGRQMDILALSVYLRYLEACGAQVRLPTQAYRGDYITVIGQGLEKQHGDGWRVDFSVTSDDDAERELDTAISVLRTTLGEARFKALRDHAKDTILAEIRDDLAGFRVEFDNWYSETALIDAGRVEAALEVLDAAAHLYDKDGARWFRTTELGDEKDRVVVRENGQKTYFASDIAYHHEKFQRGFDTAIDVWGADHHGYVPRVRAAISALGQDPDRLEIVLVQFAALVRGGEKVAMSTRAGEFVTLQTLVEEVGVDAARFFYVMRRAEQHLEFDLELATAQNNENPVYYVQYAHARIASVDRQHAERKLVTPALEDMGMLAELLTESAERELAMTLWHYPSLIEGAAAAREPHQLTQYLRDLATAFHAYYNAHKVLVDEPRLRAARMALVAATKQVLANGLGILGISAPESM